jgi:hypothetical protein
MINPQKGIDLMNNISIINKIFFVVTLFQHQIGQGVQMTKEVLLGYVLV